MAVTFALCFFALLIQLTMLVMKKRKHFVQVQSQNDSQSTSEVVSLAQTRVQLIDLKSRILTSLPFFYV